MAFNPCEMTVRMKLVETDGVAYYIGNCNMDINLKDTVITLIEPNEGTRETVLLIKLENKNRRRFHNHRNGQGQPEEFDEEDSTHG